MFDPYALQSHAGDAPLMDHAEGFQETMSVERHVDQFLGTQPKRSVRDNLTCLVQDFEASDLLWQDDFGRDVIRAWEG